MEKAYGYTHFPDKFLAGTGHLSNEDLGIYQRMLDRIWVFMPSQYSFPDKLDNWMELTGIHHRGKLKRIRNRFLDPNRLLFRTRKVKGGVICVQNGLKKNLDRIRAKSRQNSLNASRRYKDRPLKRNKTRALAVRPQCERTAIDHIILACFYNYTKSLEKESLRENKKLEKIKFRDKISESLGEIFSAEQAKSLGNLCPELTPEYVSEKLDLLKQRQPKNKAGFLFAAITQNYRASEKVESNSDDEEKKTAPAQKIKKVLDENEFQKLPAEKQADYVMQEHVVPDRNEYALTSKPEKIEDIFGEFIFGTISLGEHISEKDFNKLEKRYKKHFKRIRVPMRTVKKFSKK